jgi:DNA-binding protein
MFLACSAMNMATEIANVYINEICIDTLEVSVFGKIGAVSSHLSQKQVTDFGKLVEKEEAEMDQKEEQTISVGRGVKMEKLLTLCLLKFSKFDRLKLIAAGGAINDVILLALKLTTGKISKDTIGVKLIHMYSITTRQDANRRIAAISIYLRKGVTTEYSKRHNDLLKKIKSGY